MYPTSSSGYIWFTRWSDRPVNQSKFNFEPRTTDINDSTIPHDCTCTTLRRRIRMSKSSWPQKQHTRALKVWGSVFIVSILTQSKMRTAGTTGCYLTAGGRWSARRGGSSVGRRCKEITQAFKDPGCGIHCDAAVIFHHTHTHLMI